MEIFVIKPELDRFHSGEPLNLELKFMNEYFGIIAIRKGSKGLADKNRQSYEGIPLYSIACDRFRNLQIPFRVSTDYHLEELRCLLEKEYHSRPSDLATDTADISDVIREIIIKRDLQEKKIIFVQVTSPRTDAELVKRAIDTFEENGASSMVATVVKTDPGILKHGCVDNGRFIPLKDKKFCFANRQELPQTYKMTGAIYVFNASDYLRSNGFPGLEIIPLEVRKELSLDIDTKEDFDL